MTLLMSSVLRNRLVLVSIIAALSAGLAVPPRGIGASGRPIQVARAEIGYPELSATRLTWFEGESGNYRLRQWSHGRTRLLAELSGPGELTEAESSSRLVTFGRLDQLDEGETSDFVSLERTVVPESGRVLRLDRCRATDPRCGCVRRGEYDDALTDTGITLAVDGDHLAVGRMGCAKGVTIYRVTTTGRLHRLAYINGAVASGFVLAGRYLATEYPEINSPARGYIALFDWRQHRRLHIWRHLPDPYAGDITLGRWGSITGRFDPIDHGRVVKLVFGRDGSRRRLRALAPITDELEGPIPQWRSRHVFEAVTTRRDADQNEIATHRFRFDLRTGRRTQLPIRHLGRDHPTWSYTARCMAWTKENPDSYVSQLYVGSIDGRPTDAAACSG